MVLESSENGTSSFPLKKEALLKEEVWRGTGDGDREEDQFEIQNCEAEFFGYPCRLYHEKYNSWPTTMASFLPNPLSFEFPWLGICTIAMLHHYHDQELLYQTLNKLYLKAVF